MLIYIRMEIFMCLALVGSINQLNNTTRCVASRKLGCHDNMMYSMTKQITILHKPCLWVPHFSAASHQFLKFVKSKLIVNLLLSHVT